MHISPSPEPQVLNAAGVARLLGRRTAESFHNRRAALEASGFPRKLPGINGWSRPAIMRWLEVNGAAPSPANDGEPPRRSPLEARFA